jgi:hypothetical protein
MGKGVRGVDGKWVGGDELRRRSEVHRQSPHRATGLAQGWITWSVPWHESPILAPADALLGCFGADLRCACDSLVYNSCNCSSEYYFDVAWPSQSCSACSRSRLKRLGVLSRCEVGAVLGLGTFWRI